MRLFVPIVVFLLAAPWTFSSCQSAAATNRPQGSARASAGNVIEAPRVSEGDTPHISSNAYIVTVQEMRDVPILMEVTPESKNLNIDRLAWLEGRWIGEGLGGVCEETWCPPLGEGKERAMIGMFRLMDNTNVPNFYELMTLVNADDGTVTLRLVHLSKELVPWEKPGKTTDFRLIGIKDTTAWFEGLTMHREGDALVIYVAMNQHDGSVKEGILHYRLS